MDWALVLFFELEMDFGIRSFSWESERKRETEITGREWALTRKIMQFALERKRKNCFPLVFISRMDVREQKSSLQYQKDRPENLRSVWTFGMNWSEQSLRKKMIRCDFPFFPLSFSGILQGEVAFRESLPTVLSFRIFLHAEKKVLFLQLTKRRWGNKNSRSKDVQVSESAFRRLSTDDSSERLRDVMFFLSLHSSRCDKPKVTVRLVLRNSKSIWQKEEKSRRCTLSRGHFPGNLLPDTFLWNSGHEK